MLIQHCVNVLCAGLLYGILPSNRRVRLLLKLEINSNIFVAYFINMLKSVEVLIRFNTLLYYLCFFFTFYFLRIVNSLLDQRKTVEVYNHE